MNIPETFIKTLELAVYAGKLIMDVYKSHRPDITLKADDSPLTRADMLSHHFLVEELSKLGYPVISEEGDPEIWKHRHQWKRYWLVDPLDGTREFVKRNGEFTVNIALMENGNPIWGVIYAPVLKTMYAGIVGAGAWVWEQIDSDVTMDALMPDKGNRLPLFFNRSGLTVVASKSHLSQSTRAFINRLNKIDNNLVFVQAGSSLKFCKIATGEADIYPRMDSIMEWDIAAGHAIVLASGGYMAKWPEQIAPEYNSSEMRSPQFVAIAPDRDVNWFLEKLSD